MALRLPREPPVWKDRSVMCDIFGKAFGLWHRGLDSVSPLRGQVGTAFSDPPSPSTIDACPLNPGSWSCFEIPRQFLDAVTRLLRRKNTASDDRALLYYQMSVDASTFAQGLSAGVIVFYVEHSRNHFVSSCFLRCV